MSIQIWIYIAEARRLVPVHPRATFFKPSLAVARLDAASGDDLTCEQFQTKKAFIIIF
jgi:hypothetical protein